MSLSNLLNHRCDIYHIEKTETKTKLGYNIPTKEFSYSDMADIKNIPCHINVSPSDSLTQTESANEYIFKGKITLPIDIDIRVNDKIVDLETGLSFTAQYPNNIRNHHKTADIFRTGTIKGAI